MRILSHPHAHRLFKQGETIFWNTQQNIETVGVSARYWRFTQKQDSWFGSQSPERYKGVISEVSLFSSSNGTGTNIALNKPATASSSDNSFPAVNLTTDGTWASNWSQLVYHWFKIDLQTPTIVDSMTIIFNTSTYHAKEYEIAYSDDNTNWTVVKSIFPLATPSTQTFSNIQG